MRLRRLDLTRYGKFTERSLDFGEKPVGQPDLHILYGPNEAGKSTTLAAWLDLLFGIGQQTRYSFLHQGPTMRIGAVLEIGGKEVTLARIKTRSNALLDAFDAPIPEAMLQAGLGGLGRETYQAMFSLDDETLVEGGESILASQGDLGELLFSTSAGLTGLSKRLKSVQAEAEGFIRSPRTGRLFDLKKQLEALDTARKDIDVQAPEYARRTDAAKAAEGAWRQANTALAAAQSTLAALLRVDAGLPLAQRLAGLRARLDATSDAPQPPLGWAAELGALMADKAAAEAQADLLRSQIQRLTQRLTETPADDLVLTLSQPIAEAEALRSAHDEAVKDLPTRTDALQTEETAIAALLARLNLTGQAPQDVLLPPASIAGLRGLIATRSGLQTALTAARTEAATAAATLVEAEDRLADVGGATAAPDALAGLVAAIRARDPAQALRQAEAQTRAAEATLAERIAALAPWTGTAQTLAAQTIPSRDRIDQWALRAEAARHSLADLDNTLRRLRADLAQHLAALNARAQSGRVLPQDLTEARTERERLWALHLSNLTLDTAQGFEAALRHDDLLATERAALGAQEAVQAQTQGTIAALRAEVEAAEQDQTQVRAVSDALTEEWAAMLHSLPALASPADLRLWLDLRAQALNAQAELSRLQAAEALAAGQLGLATADLQAMLPPESGTGFEVLLARATAFMAASDRLAALSDAARTQRRAHLRRQEDLARAEAALQVWQADWAALCQGTWMQSCDPGLAGEQIPLLEDLRSALASRASLADRVAKMTANRAAFGHATAALADRLGLTGPDTAALWQAITQRLRRAEDARTAAVKDNADLRDAADKLATLDDLLRQKNQRLQGMEACFWVEGADAVAAALAAAAERAGWQTAITGLQDDLIQTTRSAALPEALAAIAAVEGQDLDALIAHARAVAEAAQTGAQTRFADLSKAEAELDGVGGDDAVARLDEARQTLLLQIAEEAERHLRHRFGIIAVEHALRAYRDSHRSAMMARASAAFRTISRGAYTGLAAQPDKDREVLVALSADGTSKLAPDLSKGTRFQLYLALRAAGYHVLAEARPPVPFIADDIMETFDNDRSAEAFAVLADMARVGQVIYLTHHQHLCDIARKVCPEARISSL
jgi:uncharacterized protein YhaN